MNWGAMWLAFRLGLRKGWSEPAFTLGGLAIFLALVISYGQLLKVLPDRHMVRLHLTHEQVVWYLIITELTLLGNSPRFREMQDEVRSGAMAILLLRPVGFWPMKLASWTGEQAMRMVWFVPVAALAGGFLTGWTPPRTGALLLVPSYFAALLMIMCSYMLIGCTSLWLGESRPVFFLYQKLVFLLGGLLWPLAFYPSWLRRLAWCTPFPAMVAAPGDFALGFKTQELGLQLCLQFCWLALVLVLCTMMEAAMRRRIMGKGG